MPNKIRVRFAPSPTGYVHVGGLRTALYNYLYAQKNKGEFLLRIEDTDRNRYVEGAIEKIQTSLKWAGIGWKGEMYVQSEHLDIYQKYAAQLVKGGQAYYCFCEPERLEKMRKEQAAGKQAPMYDRYCLLNVNEAEVNKNLKNKCPYTIRLKVPKDELIEFGDIVRGKVQINTNTIDDQILLKSDGYPTYHLANVVDDHLMEITHVIRGEEWLPSTPKHILLYRAFGWKIPQFAHLPLLLNPDKTKLSKRQGDVAVEDYVRQGYLKETIINFVALLGWNPGEGSTQEIFSLDELIEKFELTHVHKAGAVFDLKKLDWLNAQYIKKLTIDKLYELSLDFLKQKDFFQTAREDKKTEEYVKKVLAIEQDRLLKLYGVGEDNKFFFQNINYDKKLLLWKDMGDEELKNSLEKAKSILENIPEKDWTREKLGKILLEAAGDKRGEFLWPLRAALTGEQKSPPPSEVAWVLGQKACLERLEKALKML